MTGHLSAGASPSASSYSTGVPPDRGRWPPRTRRSGRRPPRSTVSAAGVVQSRVIRVEGRSPSRQDIREACEVLGQGGL